MHKTRPTPRQQRKRRVRMSKEAPFPVPIAAVTGERASNSHWIYYTATLHSNGVTVQHSGDMEFLYRMGFFGKGSMSRGQPQWAECQRLAALPYPRQPGDSGGWQGLLQARVTSRRRYMTHLKWHLLRAGDREAMSRVEQDLQMTTVEEGPKRPHTEDGWGRLGGHPPAEDTGREQFATNREQSERRRSSDDEMETVPEEQEEAQAGNGRDDGTAESGKPPCSTDDATTDWAEGDAEFGGTEDRSNGDDGNKSVGKKVSSRDDDDDALMSWETGEGDARFWGMQVDDGASVEESGSSGHPSSSAKPVDCVSCAAAQRCVCGGCCPAKKTTALSGGEGGGGSSIADRAPSQDGAGDRHRELACDVRKDDLARDSKKDRAQDSKKELACDTNTELACDMSTDPACDADKDLAHTCTTRSSAADDHHDDVAAVGPAVLPDPGQADRVEACKEDTLPSDGNAQDFERSHVENALDCEDGAPDGTPPSQAPWSEFCQQTDGDGESDVPLASGGGQRLFVVPDSDEEEATSDGQVCRTRTLWKPVVKWDPLPVRECLHLSSEEAFFLSYGLGCLTVLDSDQTSLTLSELWGTFCRCQPDFVPCYVAYHYYRSKNWVPKTGLKFGCTFLLYKDGPPFYHGSYSVVVQFVDEEGGAVEGQHGERRQFSWTSLAGLKRITEHVGKELLMCYVVKPRDMTPEDMLTPACIPRFHVKEMVVSRWLSSQERESKALDDLP